MGGVDAMSTLGCIIWVAGTIACAIALYAIQAPLTRSYKPLRRLVVLLIKILLAIACAFLSVALELFIVYRDPYFFGMAYVALTSDIIADILSWPCERMGNAHHKDLKRRVITAVVTVAYLAYGTINMQVVTPHEIAFETDKVTREHTFVFMSDLHVSRSQGWEVTESTVAQIRDLNPEFVVLGGDITDEFTSEAEMRSTYELLSTIACPVYFVYGNHDVQPHGDWTIQEGYGRDELTDAIREGGLIVLEDEWVDVGDNLVILGREDAFDPTRKPTDKLTPRPAGAFVVCVDHTPYETEDIVATEADVQLSGHTHAGQLFPLQWIYNLLGYDAYGSYRHGATQLVVSSGAAGWGFPFRSEEGCHFEVVTVKPAPSEG